MTFTLLLEHITSIFLFILILVESIFSAIFLSFQYVSYLLHLTYPTYFQNSATYAHESMIVFYDNMMHILFYTLGAVIVILTLTILRFNNNTTSVQQIINLLINIINFLKTTLFGLLKKFNINLENLLNSDNKLVLAFTKYLTIGFMRRRYYKHESLTEFIWTIVPF